VTEPGAEPAAASVNWSVTETPVTGTDASFVTA
jgi:hypothetical protein